MTQLYRTLRPAPPQLIALRQQIHAHPELSGAEEKTAALVAQTLREMGIAVQEHVGGHGVIGSLTGTKPGRVLVLRADMDALPIQETSPISYKSQIPGRMHACGHDGHVACLLGAAGALAAMSDLFAGEARFLFQPAEETGQGAKAMIADGALDGADAIAALHAWPPLEVGQIGVRPGPMTAGVTDFRIEFTGVGGHAGYPHLTIDPIPAAAALISALQTIVSREISPLDPAVLSVTQIHAGSANNIVPTVAVLAGTIRTQSPSALAQIPDAISRISRGIADAHRCEAKVEFEYGNPPVVNDEGLTSTLREAASNILGVENVVALPAPAMGAEDFAEYLALVPGVFFRLGIGRPAPLHSSNFDFNDDAITVGANVLSAFASRFLGDGSES